MKLFHDISTLHSAENARPLRQPTRLGWFLAWLFLVFVVAAWRWEIVAAPPYWDFAMGLFAEADYLVEHDFDYRGLVEQLRFGAGGVATYITSVMPTLVALVMKLSPTVGVSLVVCHLVQFGAAAAILLWVFALLRPRVGDAGAALTALVVLTTPLFAAQVDMLGMDMPLAACFLPLVAALLRGQPWRAIGWSAAAFLIKTSGMLAVVVIILYLALSLPLARPGHGARRTRRGWLALAAALGLLASEIHVNDWIASLVTSQSERLWQASSFGAQTLAQSLVWCPDLVAALAVAVALAWLSAKLALWRQRRLLLSRPLATLQQLGEQCLGQHGLWVLSLLTVVGALAGILGAYAIPRYLLLPVPFLWLAVVLGAVQVTPWPRVVTALLVIVAAFNLLNEKGRFYPALEGDHARTGALLERSREYLADHLANIDTVRVLEQAFSDQPIVAGNPFVYFLSLPRLGYLRRGAPLSGYSLNTFSPPTFPDVRRLVRDAPADPVFVWAPNTFAPIGWCPVPAPESLDARLHRDNVDPPVVLFRKRWQPEEAKQPLATRYRTWLFADQPELIVETEIETPAQQQAVEQRLRRDLANDPDDVEARHNLGVVLARQRKLDEAVVEYQKVIERRPKRAITFCRLGDALADLDRLEEAVAAYAQAIEPDHSLFDAFRGLGMTQARRQDYGEAQRRLAQAAQLQPHDEEIWFQLGLAERLAGQFEAAAVSLKMAIERNPKHADSLLQLGLLDELRGNDVGAAQWYRRALAARPRWFEAANSLAWLLATSPVETLREGKQAVKLAEVACQQTNFRSYGLIDTLAAAYAEVGKFRQAGELAEKAEEMARQAGETEVAAEIQARRLVYETGRPFHRPPRDAEESAR